MEYCEKFFYKCSLNNRRRITTDEKNRFVGSCGIISTKPYVVVDRTTDGRYQQAGYIVATLFTGGCACEDIYESLSQSFAGFGNTREAVEGRGIPDLSANV